MQELSNLINDITIYDGNNDFDKTPVQKMHKSPHGKKIKIF